MGQPQHGYTTRTARAEARPEDSGISSRQLQATRGCQVSRATRHEGTRDPDKQPHHHQKQRQSGGAAPVTGPCTRSGALHPFRRGALPTDRVQRPNTQEQTRNWHTEPLTATPLHAHLGPTGGGMGTPPTPPPALRPTPAHSDTSYTLKCEEPDNLSAKTKPIRERPDNKAIRASPHARDTPSNATRPFPHPATRKGPPPHEGTAGLVNESQDPWIVTDTSRVAPSRAIVRLMVSPAR